MHERTRPPLKSLLLGIVALLAICGGLLFTHGAIRFTPLAATARRAKLASPPPPPTPTTRPHPTPSATPSSTSSVDAARGCAPNAPSPFPTAIANGEPPQATNQPPNEVALTFDDGPSGETTPGFLDYLERTHTPATFFVIGNQARYRSDIIQREWRDGFAIGVHTWDHANMTQLTSAQMRSELGSTLQVLHTILGANACIWLWRPPYGAYNATVLSVAASYGLTTINWDDEGLDWEQPGVNTIASMILNLVHPGSIILMHDGPTHRAQTLAALPIILKGLSARGLRPVTLPQLLADGGYPGVRTRVPQNRDQ